MNKVAAFWQAHLTVNGEIAWPERQVDRDALARTFFGLGFVEALDSWIGWADNLLENPSNANSPLPRRSTTAAEEDSYRSCLRPLTVEQITTVRKLVRKCVSGALFSALVHVDQLPLASFQISIVDRRKSGSEVQGRVFPANDQRSLDLHDELSEWVWAFSRYGNELISKNQDEGGNVSVRWIT
jgi:hypothetical protein